jgi:hypothetical protein
LSLLESLARIRRDWQDNSRQLADLDRALELYWRAERAILDQIAASHEHVIRENGLGNPIKYVTGWRRDDSRNELFVPLDELRFATVEDRETRRECKRLNGYYRTRSAEIEAAIERQN